jgi:hypothetical protein
MSDLYRSRQFVTEVSTPVEPSSARRASAHRLRIEEWIRPVERCLACEPDGRGPWSAASLARPTVGNRGALPRLRGRRSGTVERCLACEADGRGPWSAAPFLLRHHKAEFALAAKTYHETIAIASAKSRRRFSGSGSAWLCSLVFREPL